MTLQLLCLTMQLFMLLSIFVASEFTFDSPNLDIVNALGLSLEVLVSLPVDVASCSTHLDNFFEIGISVLETSRSWILGRRPLFAQEKR